jgi:hypothetical protein
MNCDPSNTMMPAPCIVETGILVQKQDIRRILADLGRVGYIHIQDGICHAQGEGYILEVFADREQSTIIANHALYLNVYSFDYLEIKVSPTKETFFDLIQENRQLRLIPLSNPLQERENNHLSASAISAVLTEVLTAKLDAEMDDEGTLPF